MARKKNKEEKLLADLLKNNIISRKDQLPAKAVLAWLHRGEDAARKISSKAVKNLHEANCVSGGKLKANFKKDTVVVEFALLVCAAQGLVMMAKGIHEIGEDDE